MSIESDNQSGACSENDFAVIVSNHLESFQAQLVKVLEDDFEKHLSSREKAEQV